MEKVSEEDLHNKQMNRNTVGRKYGGRISVKSRP